MIATESQKKSHQAVSGWRLKWYTVIFEADTKAGKLFDLILAWTIVSSLLVIMLSSVSHIHTEYEYFFNVTDWLFTFIITLEDLARIICSTNPVRYVRSFLGIIDLISILPSFLALFIPDAYVLVDVRILRLLRIFRILKMSSYVVEFLWLMLAIADSRRKIGVFIAIIMTLVVILGSLLYVVEGPKNGFTSVPTSIYWAISTITTVGFGDITPHTDIGRFIASLVMMFGWGILAVPTGIVSAEMIAQHAVKKTLTESTTRTCHTCMTEGHSAEAKHCNQCGALLTQYFGEIPTLTPKIAFASSMIYLINADGKIEPHEISRLLAAVKDDRVLLEVSTRYTKFHSTEEFIVNCSNLLDYDQKLSLLVNLYDAILGNGEILQQEMQLFDKFLEVFNFKQSEIEPYLHSISVKNNKNLFSL